MTLRAAYRLRMSTTSCSVNFAAGRCSPRQVVPCLVRSWQFSKCVPYARFFKRLSWLFPLRCRTSWPTGHSPTNANKTSRWMRQRRGLHVLLLSKTLKYFPVVGLSSRSRIVRFYRFCQLQYDKESAHTRQKKSRISLRIQAQLPKVDVYPCSAFTTDKN